MDGLLVVFLIGWVISRMNKKNKKPKKTTSGLGAYKENSAQLKATHAAKLYAELDKRNSQLAEEKTAVLQHEIGEGESAAVHFQMEETFRGSMQVDSNEGECICDPELEHEREQVTASESVYASEIGREPLMDFSALGLLQGVVMSEILTRPVQRVRRR